MDLPRAPLPRMARVRQRLPDDHVADPAIAVREALTGAGLGQRVRPGQRVAITAGSRGIANIPAVIRTVADGVRAVGAEPFVVPAMGSHGGATAEGQRARAGRVRHHRGRGRRADPGHDGHRRSSGTSTTARRSTWTATPRRRDARHRGQPRQGAHGVSGRHRERPVQDAGDRPGQAARRRDDPRARPRRDASRWPRSGRCWAAATSSLGLALVENAYHQAPHRSAPSAPTASSTTDRELLTLANSLLPRVPFDQLDLLIVDWLGKNISGSGMDYNVVGMWRRIGGEQRPDLRAHRRARPHAAVGGQRPGRGHRRLHHARACSTSWTFRRCT